MPAVEASDALYVPAKKVPPPTTVSPELRKLIAMAMPVEMPLPTTAEGWRQMHREADESASKLVRDVTATLGAKIEPTTVANVPCFHITPRHVATENEGRLIFHVHGGAFVFNAGIAATGEGALLADACQTRVLSVDYRMPPDHPFPAAPDDVLTVWLAVSAERDAGRMAMAGTSAGGGLIMTTILRLREQGLPLPAALFLGTPGADLSPTGDSIFLNAEVDNALGRYKGRLEACIKLYAAGRDLKDPLLSPLYGELAGFPPTILISGTRDLLLSATVGVHRKLRGAGVVAELHVYEGMSHAAYLVSFPSPESRDSLSEIAQFFRRYVKQ